MIEELGLEPPILAYGLLGPARLEATAEAIASIKRNFPASYARDRAGYAADIASAVNNLMIHGQAKVIPDIANIFKANGLSDLLTDTAQHIRDIVRHFARVGRETAQIADLTAFKERQQRRIDAKQEWSRPASQGNRHHEGTNQPAVFNQFRMGRRLLDPPYIVDLALALSENPVAQRAMMRSIVSNFDLWDQVNRQAAAQQEDLEQLLGLTGKIAVIINVEVVDDREQSFQIVDALPRDARITGDSIRSLIDIPGARIG